MKLFLGMKEVSDDISFVDGISVSKCIKCGVGVILGCQCRLKCQC